MPKTTSREEATLAKMDKNPNAPRYVTCDLRAAQKEELLTFIRETNEEDLFSWMEGMVSSGHILSVKSLDVGYQCSVTGSSQCHSHPNMCLISRASTAVRAVYSVMFKDTQILAGTWPVTNRIEELDA